nr:hypothetical protein [Kofleriaceae bacterium]
MERLEARMSRLARMWVWSLAVAAGGGAVLGARVSSADAPAAKELILVDGDQRLELHPWGLSVATASAQATVTATDLGATSLTTKRKVGIGIVDKNGTVQMTLQASADHTAQLVVGPYTELELQSDQSSVDLRAADEARVSAHSDPFTYAELAAKGAQPCWTLGVKTGTAVRTCNDKK